MGYPIKVHTQMGTSKNKRKETESRPVLSREERLRQRNAKKEALVVIDEEDVIPTVAEVTHRGLQKWGREGESCFVKGKHVLSPHL